MTAGCQACEAGPWRRSWDMNLDSQAPEPETLNAKLSFPPTVGMGYKSLSGSLRLNELAGVRVTLNPAGAWSPNWWSWWWTRLQPTVHFPTRVTYFRVCTVVHQLAVLLLVCPYSLLMFAIIVLF